MANIDTVSGITRINDYTLEVTANVNLGAGIDDLADHVIYEKSGGVLRFGSGCTTDFYRCTVIMTDSAAALGGDNFNSPSARFNGTCAARFFGCSWMQEDGVSRNDFDIQIGAAPKFYKDAFGRKVYLLIDNGADQYNHFASSAAVIDGLVVDHRGTGGAFEVVIPPPINDLELVDNNPGADIRHFVCVASLWPNNSTYSVRGLKARRVMLYQGNATKTLILIDPKGDIRSSTDDWQNPQCVIKIHRTYKATPLDALTAMSVSVNCVVSFTDNGEIVFDAATSALSVELLQDTKPFNTYAITTRNSYRRSFAAFGFIPSVKEFLITERVDGSPIDDGAVLLFPDAGVTATSQASVEAYTQIANASQLYDCAHVYSIIRADRHKVGELLASAAGTQIDFLTNTLTITSAAPSGFPLTLSAGNVTAFTNGSSFSMGSKFNKIIAPTIYLQQASVFPSSCNLDADVVLGAVGTLSNVTVTGNLDFAVAGTYTTNSCSLQTLTNSSGGAVTLQIDPSTTIATLPDLGENITIVSAPVTLDITNLVVGGSLVIYDDEDPDFQARGTTLLYVPSVAATTYVYEHSGATNDIVINFIADGYIEQDVEVTLTSVNQSISVPKKLDESL